MDKPFAGCLAEIEKSYLVLPKAARIRVERWVEKLVSTGNNPTWKKHRNEYARLLLNMVIARNLEAPFNVMPPETPLAPFSSQFKAHNKNLLGPHESSFWRELYQNLGEAQTSFGNEEEKDSYGHHPVKKDRVHEAMMSKMHGSQQVPSSAANQVTLSREIQSLNLLVREQSQRIKLLEQQLHDERSQHELQIQRLHYSNRVEVNNLKKQIEDFAVELSVQELSPSRRATSQYLNSTMDSMGPHSQYAMRLGPSFDVHQTRPPRPVSPFRRGGAASPFRGAVPMPESTGKRGMMSFLEQKNHVTAALNGLSVMEPDSFDITPRPKNRPSSFLPQPADEPTLPRTSLEHFESTYGADESHFGSPGGLDAPSQYWHGGYQPSAVGDQEDEAFLAHIDRFQSEIKKINTNITLTSPERF